MPLTPMKMTDEKWHTLSVAETEQRVKSNAASGLSPGAARRRYRKGAGRLFLYSRKGVPSMLKELMADFSLVLLIVMSILSLCFRETALGATALCIIVINTGICLALYYRSWRLFEGFYAFYRPSATVVRSGKAYAVDAEHVVVGDVVLIGEGDILCFDARLVTSDALRVRVRYEKDEYAVCDKFADAGVRENETDVRQMPTMVHAGSEILAGSARAIVTAVGAYTYLGARTGQGIRIPSRAKIPEGLLMLRKYCSGFAMILSLIILPFSILSLIISDGDVSLLTTFTSVLAVAASSMSQLALTVCRIFFERQARAALRTKHISAVRSADVMDRLITSDYLFLLDGAVANDGVLHFESALCADGEIRHFGSVRRAAAKLTDHVALYATAEKNTLTTGVRAPCRYVEGLREFLKASAYDTEALAIRCPISGYVTGSEADRTDRVFYTQGGVKYVLSVGRDASLLSRCTHTYLGNERVPMSEQGRGDLLRAYEEHRAKGKHVLLFSVATAAGTTLADDAREFLGMLVLSEVSDPAFTSAMRSVAALGTRVIAFSNIKERRNESLPATPMPAGTVHIREFLEHGEPITYRFGSINGYDGLSTEDVITLVREAHNKGKKVTVVGFDDVAAEIGAEADVFVSCSALPFRFSGYFEESVEALTVAGEAVSGSCTQRVKSRADVLLPRPAEGKGGMASLFRAMLGAGAAYHNLGNFFRYVLCTQFIRMVTVMLPMFFGSAPVDARHLLFCGFLVDLCVMLIFASENSAVENAKGYRRLSEEFHAPISQNAGMILSGVIAALVAVVLPRLAGLWDLFGSFTCQTEFTFLSLVLLHLSVMYSLRIESRRRYPSKKANPYAIGLLTFVFVFFMLCFAVEPIGLLFGIEALPFGFLMLSLLPMALHLLLFRLLSGLRFEKE
ncbi:MAG: hypothetical protein E7664_00810 [Ruminococcaceae bacterium]|nr:hypothetical protein [Oscillospiraceae bacterium]